MYQAHIKILKAGPDSFVEFYNPWGDTQPLKIHDAIILKEQSFKFTVLQVVEKEFINPISRKQAMEQFVKNIQTEYKYTQGNIKNYVQKK